MRSLKPGELVLATVALAIGAFMNVLDSTIVNVSLSHIAGDFGVAPNNGTWVITSYAVSEAIFLPLIGWLTTRFGVLRQYIWATLLFTLASMFCGISPTFEILLISRVLQGVVGASMIPLSQSIMMMLYPKDKKAVALGIWAMTVVIAPIVGPILGGWITDTFSWRWSFYINLPFGIISTFIIHKLAKSLNMKDDIKKEPIDIWGLVFLTIGIASLQLMLDKGNDLNWFESPTIIILAITSFIFLVILGIWEWHQEKPVVNVRLFLNRNFTIGAISLTIGQSIFFASVVVIPLWLQNYMGYTAYLSGLATASLGIPILLLAPIIGRIIPKVDVRKLIVIGFLLFAIVAIFFSAFPPNVTMKYIAANRFYTGFGLALFFTPLNFLTLSHIPENELPSASGLYNFMRNMGSSFGTSLSVNYWTHKTAFFHSSLVGAINYGNPNFTDFLQKIPGTISSKLAAIDYLITNQAATMSLNQLSYVSGLCILALIPFIFLAKNKLTKKDEN